MPSSSLSIRVFTFLLTAAIVLGCRPSSISDVREAAAAEATGGDMVAATIQGQNVEGIALGGVGRELHLLGRDGRLWQLDPDRTGRRPFQKLSTPFHPYSPSEFRAVLLRELGGNYEVSGTSHYLIAHPRGQSDRWAERFEDLYRSFVHYFSVRGCQPADPPFPLVGIVCKDRNDFVRRAADAGVASGGVMGYYNVESNRINLYDMGGKDDSPNWRRNAGVLIHEATHQMAFNTGIHSRYSRPPLWLAEGLAMLFEAPGVCDSYNHAQPADRVNRDRLSAFRKFLAPHHRPEWLASLVASDDFFHQNTAAAYAESWALSFFLIETQPSQYIQYLRRTASREPFQESDSARRTADFTAIFGADWRMLESRFLRFMAAW